jgi:hypothetical protein
VLSNDFRYRRPEGLTYLADATAEHNDVWYQQMGQIGRSHAGRAAQTIPHVLGVGIARTRSNYNLT